MSNKILFVFEGAKKEKQIADSFTKCYPDNNLVVQCAYCTTIYNLYNKLIADEDLDTFSLLKEMPINRKSLGIYKRNDFAEVYLFFDYDGHSASANDEKLMNILKLFNEETEFGKIFINYPMVESLKHYSEFIDFKLLKVKAKAKENRHYKQKVNKECNKDLIDFNLYSTKIWAFLINLHLKKMNYIVNKDYSFPSKSASQIEIFIKQQKEYINIDSTIAVLSSFPIFLFDYYGNEFIRMLVMDFIE